HLSFRHFFDERSYSFAHAVYQISPHCITGINQQGNDYHMARPADLPEHIYLSILCSSASSYHRCVEADSQVQNLFLLATQYLLNVARTSDSHQLTPAI